MKGEPKPNGGELSRCHTVMTKPGVLWVERLSGNDRQIFVVTSTAPYGFYTHWSEKLGTVPCWANHDLCDGGHKEITLRQCFLLQCHSRKKRKQVFVWLTPGAVKDLEEQAPQSQSLRGLTIEVIRTAADNGRLNVEVKPTSVVPVRAEVVDPYMSIMNFLNVDPAKYADQRSLGTIPLDAGGDQKTA